MSATFGGFRLFKPVDTNSTMQLPSVASTAISVGDLLYWDTSAKTLKPMDVYVGSGTAATDRTALSPLFAGVALQGKLAADTTAGYPGFSGEVISCATDALYEAACVSATFEPGALVAVVSSGAAAAGAISPQTLVATTTAEQAIGYVVERYAAATTTVRVRLIGRWSPFKYTDVNNITPAINVL